MKINAIIPHNFTPFKSNHLQQDNPPLISQETIKYPSVIMTACILPYLIQDEDTKKIKHLLLAQNESGCIPAHYIDSEGLRLINKRFCDDVNFLIKMYTTKDNKGAYPAQSSYCYKNTKIYDPSNISNYSLVNFPATIDKDRALAMNEALKDKPDLIKEMYSNQDIFGDTFLKQADAKLIHSLREIFKDDPYVFQNLYFKNYTLENAIDSKSKNLTYEALNEINQSLKKSPKILKEFYLNSYNKKNVNRDLFLYQKDEKMVRKNFVSDFNSSQLKAMNEAFIDEPDTLAQIYLKNSPDFSNKEDEAEKEYINNTIKNLSAKVNKNIATLLYKTYNIKDDNISIKLPDEMPINQKPYDARLINDIELAVHYKDPMHIAQATPYILEHYNIDKVKELFLAKDEQKRTAVHYLDGDGIRLLNKYFSSEPEFLEKLYFSKDKEGIIPAGFLTMKYTRYIDGVGCSPSMVFASDGDKLCAITEAFIDKPEIVEKLYKEPIGNKKQTIMQFANDKTIALLRKIFNNDSKKFEKLYFKNNSMDNVFDRPKKMTSNMLKEINKSLQNSRQSLKTLYLYSKNSNGQPFPLMFKKDCLEVMNEAFKNDPDTLAQIYLTNCTSFCSTQKTAKTSEFIKETVSNILPLVDEETKELLKRGYGIE